MPTSDIILSIGHNVRPAVSEARRWTRILSPYRTPSHARSIVELAITAVPLIALWVAAWFVFSLGLWWASLAHRRSGRRLPGAPVHDPARLRPRRLLPPSPGQRLGRPRASACSRLTPYDFWRRIHAIHHATSGNLDRRGIGDVDTLTVREYLALSRWGRLNYRLYRHPAVMFGVGPAYLFILQHRLPVGLMRGGWQPWLSTMATNLAIALIVAMLSG